MLRAFPFPPPPDGDITAWHGGGEPDQLLARDISVVRWFVEERRGVSIKERSPLAEMLVRSEQYLRGAKFPGMSRDEWQHDLYAQAQVVRLSWAIRALYGRGAAVECIDDSFIDKELLQGDDLGSVRQLAGGIGLLVLAGRIVQSGGGRIITVSGNGRRGYDINWQTTPGDTVYVERKDRAFSAGLSDNAATRVRKVTQNGSCGRRHRQAAVNEARSTHAAPVG